MASHQADQLELRTHIQFPVDGLEVVAHRMGADHQVLCDVLDSAPGSQCFNDGRPNSERRVQVQLQRDSDLILVL